MADLTLHVLKQLVYSEIFRRGAYYHEEGRVYQLRREGNWISGSVLGQELYQTRLQVTSPYHSSCTCPYEDTCKHVTALGLAWLERERQQGDQAKTPAPDTPSLHDQVGALSREDLIALVGELLDTVDSTRPVVQGFLIRHAAQSYGHVPGEASTEAALICRQVREWLSQVPPEREYDEYEDYAEEEDPDEWDGSDHEEAAGQVQAFIDGLCQPRAADALPFSMLALSGVAAELVNWLAEGENGTLAQ